MCIYIILDIYIHMGIATPFNKRYGIYNIMTVPNGITTSHKHTYHRDVRNGVENDLFGGRVGVESE